MIKSNTPDNGPQRKETVPSILNGTKVGSQPIHLLASHADKRFRLVAVEFKCDNRLCEPHSRAPQPKSLCARSILRACPDDRGHPPTAHEIALAGSHGSSI